MSLADSLGRSADVTTLEESTFPSMDRRTFRSGVESSAMLARNLADVLSRRLKLASAHLLSMAALDVPGRVASQLFALVKEYGQDTPDGARIPVKLTQADLGALVGASRVWVNQALGSFRKRGLISMDREGHFTICDEDALSQRAK